MNESIINFKLPKYEELPNIDLYLDQVIALIETSLKDLKLFNDEPFLTASMINNYVKKGIVPVTNKKKYSKEHIASIFMVCIYKQVFSMDEIKKLLDIHADIINDETNPIDLERSYNYFCTEFEQNIVATFTKKQLPADSTVSYTEERQLIRNAAIAFANKLYTLHLLNNRIKKD